jgi:hypothetical protein
VITELATGQEVRRIELPEGVETVAFSADSKTLACGGAWDGTVHLREVATGKERSRLLGHKGRIDWLTFSGDGQTLATGSDDTTVLIWDLSGKLGVKGRWGALLSQTDLDACWADLAGDDAARAYQSLRRLAASPTSTIPYLRTRLQPVAPVDDQRLARLIAELDNEQFAVREKAREELETLGGLAAAACRKALEGPSSAEVRRRLKALLDKQARALWDLSPDRLSQLRALEVLERTATAEARQLLGRLAKGAHGAWLTERARESLERLNRRKK